MRARDPISGSSCYYVIQRKYRLVEERLKLLHSLRTGHGDVIVHVIATAVIRSKKFRDNSNCIFFFVKFMELRKFFRQVNSNFSTSYEILRTIACF